MKPIKYIATSIREFLNEKLECVKLYHGSNIKFKEFNDSLISSGEGSDLFGKGYYLTDNKDIAEFYAYKRSKMDRIKGYDKSGLLKTYTPIYYDDYDDYANKHKIINTFIIRGNILNSEEFIIDDEFESYIIDSFVKHTKDSDESAKNVFQHLRNNKDKIKNFRGELLYIIDKLCFADEHIINDVIKYIIRIGYDGVKYRPDNNFEGNINYWNYVIYNKSIIFTHD